MKPSYKAQTASPVAINWRAFGVPVGERCNWFAENRGLTAFIFYGLSTSHSVIVTDLQLAQSVRKGATLLDQLRGDPYCVVKDYDKLFSENKMKDETAKLLLNYSAPVTEPNRQSRVISGTVIKLESSK